MGRGVLVGGLLMCTSLMIAVVLNRSAREERVPASPQVRPERQCGQANNGVRPDVAGNGAGEDDCDPRIQYADPPRDEERC